ncbi:ABC transporter ATP-binding protein [Anaeromicropila populeti]|uniref:Quaternary amine transport ATP-binding protein n=1 Tax=Anaeromicropila populeti TaxID=37658 RepID=A0A1I6IQ66_9FIRM|nr:ABC transporter ATP-binding protein [Anaeromicropila populeti]SFR68895.1 osmoprotectant transport system ATP-binding protein [Anaeromicropila populeti]
MIEFKNVRKMYRDKTIINDFSLTINQGELVILIGPSGCGKTTLLKMLNKLVEPTSGTIYVNGKDIAKANTIQLRRNMGYVIQHTGLFPHMSIKENIELIPRLKGEPTEKIFEKTVELLKLVGLNPDEYLERLPKELSGGQQQRVGVARAFATESDIILMDEPFSALDPVTRNGLQEELFQMQKELNKTIVFVTHDMEEAIKLGDKICLLKDGEILQFDTPEVILKNPANEFVENFIGKKQIWNNPEFLKAQDFMIEEPVKINPKRNVLQAIEIMKTNHVDSLMITEKSGVLIGLVTLKDLKLKDRGLLIENVMEPNLVTVLEEEDLISVLKTMNDNHIGYVPVVNSSKQLKGLITRSSILSALSDQLLEMEVDF